MAVYSIHLLLYATTIENLIKCYSVLSFSLLKYPRCESICNPVYMPRPNFYGRNTNVFIHHMQYFIYMVMSLLWSIKTKTVFTVLFQRSLIRTKQNKFIFNIIFFYNKLLKFLHTGLIKLN